MTLSPLLDAGNCGDLETTLGNLAPNVFASGLRLDEDDSPDDLRCLDKDIGFLFSDIENELSRKVDRAKQWKNHLIEHLNVEFPSHLQRPLGSVHYVSDDGKQHLHVHFDELPLSPSCDEKHFGNMVSIEIEFDSEDATVDEMVRRLCRKFFDGSLFDYGFCCPAEEFDTKNIDRSDGGMRAVGLDASRYLPGFYWGNYFGRRLQQRILRIGQQFDSFDAIDLSDGLLILGIYPPWSWDDLENRAHAKATVETIGEQFFFNTNPIGHEDLFSVAGKRNGGGLR